MKQNLRIDLLLPVVKFWVVYTKLQTFFFQFHSIPVLGILKFFLFGLSHTRMKICVFLCIIFVV